MKIIDIIRNYINNIRTKRLPPPEQVETKIIPIICGGADKERILNVIKNEIDKYSDFYRVFLKEYDGICINGADNEFSNPLIIKDIHVMHSFTHINPNEHTKKTTIFTDEEIASQIRCNFGNAILAKYDNANIYGLFIFDKMREEYEKKLEYSYRDKEHEEIFYKSIIKKSEIYNYDWYLCSIRDWEGLRMLLESKDVKEFIERYTELNLFTILNKTIELYTDRSYNNFFEKNIDILWEASNNTLNSLESALKKIGKSEDGESKEEKIETQMLDKETMLELVRKVLTHIDPSRRLTDFFEEKYKSGRILIFNDEEKDKSCGLLEKIVKSKELAEKVINHGPCYSGYIDCCIIPINDDITDVPTIIHEFIHQYFENSRDVFTYSMEVPSVFYEKVAMDYLSNNGYGQYSEKLQKGFIHRRENDSINNTMITDRFIRYTKRKRDQGAITIDNILDDKTAKILNMFEQALYKGRDLVGTKREHAKSVIKSFSEQSSDLREQIVKFCSYSLGTYFAERYSDNGTIRSKMMELMTNPDYTFQMLINESTALERTKNQEEKEK